MSGLTKKEIPFVYKKGKRIYTKNFSFYYLQKEGFKVSPVVSKKISKKAVVRNKIKRRVRVLAKEFFDRGYLIVVVKEDISNIDFIKLKDEFKQVANKIY